MEKVEAVKICPFAISHLPFESIFSTRNEFQMENVEWQMDSIPNRNGWWNSPGSQALVLAETQTFLAATSPKLVALPANRRLRVPS